MLLLRLVRRLSLVLKRRLTLGRHMHLHLLELLLVLVLERSSLSSLSRRLSRFVCDLTGQREIEQE